MSADEVKKLCTVDSPPSLDARGKDILLCVNQPKIITANAMTTDEWHPALHKDLFLFTNGIRMPLHPDAKAIGRRIAWAFVGLSIIPEALRAAYNRPRQ